MACIEGILQLFTNFYLQRKFSIFLQNAIQSKKEIHSNRKFGSHCFCKIKKPYKNFPKLKKILIGFLLFSGGLFWRQLRFGGNWLHIIFRQIVFGSSLDLVGTGFFFRL
jgi:hypothetical protein